MATLDEPKAVEKIPGSFVKVHENPDKVALAAMLQEAKEAIESRLPFSTRENFSGRADHEYRVTHSDTVVVVTLTHGCGENFRSQRTFIREQARDLASIKVRGAKMGAELAVLMEEHCKSCDFKRPGLTSSMSITPAEYCEGAEKIDPKRSLIPEKVCPICGPADDEYPEWDECDHDY